MKDIGQFPTEVILYIRDCLFSVPLPKSEGESDLDKFLVDETLWSWRNFLSVSKSANWKNLRKATMIWSLNKNKKKSLHYLRDSSFRNFIRERIVNPRQVECSQIDFTSFEKKETLNMNNLYYLSITCSLTELPSSVHIRVLIVTKCFQLVRLGDYENLEVLKVTYCSNLITIGTNLNHLSVLHMKTSPEELLSFIPFEKLTELYLNDHMEFFLANAPRLQRLTRLTLENNCYSNSFPHLPRLPVSSVQTLSCAAFRSIDISGLSNLTNLSVEGINLVHGKEEIFPQLKSLSGISDAFNGMDFRNYPKLKKLSYTALSEESRQHLEFFENIPDTALEVRFRTENQKDGVFHVRERARSLQFLVNPASEVVVLNPKQHFSRIEVSVPMFRNLSWFQNVSILLLYVCQSLTDILPIAHVPYSEFSELSECQRFFLFGGKTTIFAIDPSDFFN
jgi:hypothetical protein